MATKAEVEQYLKEFKTKTIIFQIFFLDDRGKNTQALADLDITSIKRKEITEKLVLEDYSEGPLEEKMRGILPMWVFGKMVKDTEVYIKISMGVPSSNTICISFHPSEYPIHYPFKNKQL